jgi:hypothetical protein
VLERAKKVRALDSAATAIVRQFEEHFDLVVTECLLCGLGAPMTVSTDMAQGTLASPHFMICSLANTDPGNLRCITVANFPMTAPEPHAVGQKLLGINISGSCLEIRDYGRRDPSNGQSSWLQIQRS